MKQFSFFLLVLFSHSILAQTRFDVSSLAEFNTAHDQGNPGDSIVWESGTYSNVFMDITKDGLIVTAATHGTVVFNGDSKVEIDSDDVTLSGLQFVGGDIGTDHVIRIWGSDVLVTQVNIKDYISYKYLIIDEDSRRTTVSYSNFENRINMADQNILSILVDVEPGYHKIQYCSFKNFEGEGNDMGVEPIRIGVSSQAHLDSRSIVEYCYFTNCDGDGELISYKAAQNVIRYNTFENNSKAELVLRHGDEAIVYGNFFLNNMGGVRVREGSGHFIYNNYFDGLSRRAIYLQNESSDPLENIHIYHNTIINSQEVRLGGSGSNPPQNVTIANNIFTDPQDDLFEDATGNETWIGNISFGTLGISRPSGLTDTDPKLAENSAGLFQPESGSPAINAAESGYPEIPLYSGLDYDSELMLDVMKQARPATESDRDVGAFEFSESVIVQPHATEDNTGPSYLSSAQSFTVSVVTSAGGEISLDPASESYLAGTTVTTTATPDDGFTFSNWTGDVSGTTEEVTFSVNGNMEVGANFTQEVLGVKSEVLKIFPNPAQTELKITLVGNEMTGSLLQVLSIDGSRVLSEEIESSQETVSIDISGLPSGLYFLELKKLSNGSLTEEVQISKFVKE